MFVDAHAHLDKYDAALDLALEEIERARIFTWAVAMDLPSYERSVAIAARSAWVLPTFGVHPRRAPAYAERLKDLTRWLERSPALGEIGLDFHWVRDPAEYPAQRKVFEFFLAAARDQDKIVNLHTKGAEKEILDLLERYRIRRAVVHWYSGPPDILRALAERGVYFTLGVELLFSDAIREIARALPLECILTETDNPGGLAWLGGEVGMPSVVLKVVERIAAVKGASMENVAQAVEGNFLRLIDGDPRLARFRPRR